MATLEPELEELRTRLTADLGAVMDAVAPLTQTQADWNPAEGNWSVGEVLHHLVLSNRLFAVVARRLVQHGRTMGLAARPGSRRSWPRVRAIAEVGVSGPVRNPDRVTPVHGLPIEQLRRDLAESHMSVVAQIPSLAGLDLDALRFPHPFGFDVNLYHWVDIAGAHGRRHLTQIQAIAATPGFPPANAT